MIERYRVLYYDSYEQEFVVIREEHSLPNMVFKMHSSGLYCFIPNCADFSFVVTVEDTMAPYSKQQILAADKARIFNACLAFPSQPNYKWILCSNQGHRCSREDLGAKCIGPQRKNNLDKIVTRPTDIVQLPVEIQSLHCNITMSINIFFVSKIPFLIMLSQSIVFTTVTHLSN